MTTTPSPLTHKRTRAASLALAATLLLTTSKIFVSVATHSVGVLSEAIHSSLDLLSSLVTFFVVRASVRPADTEHPFGHGKIESLSALFEAFLLLVAGGYITYEAVVHWLDPLHQVEYLGWGLVVTGASIFVNLFVYVQNRTVARSEESIAIETNSFHFLTDVFTSVAVFAGLALIHLTGWMAIDAVIAAVVAVYVFWVGIAQIWKCLAELADTALPAEEVARVVGILEKHSSSFLGYHDLKTRRASSIRYIELHLTVCSEQTVQDAHKTCDAIEDDLMKAFREAQVNIHVEPCGTHGSECVRICDFTQVQRKQGGHLA